MSVEALTWAFQQNIQPAARKLVLIALANRADEDGFCFPGYKRLAAQCSIDRTSVIRHIEALEKDGFIQKQARTRENGSDTSNLYQVCMFAGSQSTTPPGRNLPPPVSQSATPIDEHLNNKQKNNALSRSEFLREIERERLDGRFVAYTEVESIIAIEAGNCWDYWDAYPDKKPTGSLVSGFLGWLRLSRSVKALEKISAEKSKVLGGGEVPKDPANPVQPWHERIIAEVGNDVYRAWFRPMEFDQSSYTVQAPSRFHADYIRQHYLPQLNQILPGVSIGVRKFNQQTQGA